MFPTCSKCKTEKPINEFVARKDGSISYCILCKKQSDATYRTINADKLKLYFKKRYVENKEELSIRFKTRYEQKKEKILIDCKKRYLEQRFTDDYRSNRRAREAKRRASKLNATPKWADLEAIKLFYKNCPKGYEVDHIIPLQGKEVCGLHVLNNLQYLSKHENRQKYNKLLEVA